MIFVGSDHGGFTLKERIKEYLESQKLEYEDLGTYNTESTNYVDYSYLVAENVAKNNAIGVLCCSSGIGVSIVANKVNGVRAALCTSDFHAEFARKHNDSNIICFGQKASSEYSVLRMLDIFLNTEFEGGRHKFRVDRITEIENDIIKEKV